MDSELARRSSASAGDSAGIDSELNRIRREVERLRTQLAEREHADQAARVRAEAAQRRATFLLDSSVMLTSSLEYERTLSRLAALTVERVADFCVIALTGDHATSVPVALANADRAKLEVASSCWQALEIRDMLGVRDVERFGRSRLHEQLPPAAISCLAEHMRNTEPLDWSSALVVPLVARERVIGSLTWIASQTRPAYDVSDLDTAEDLARRAAAAVDSARLYMEAQEAIRVREELLGIVSHDLRSPLSGVVLRCSALIELFGVDPTVRPHIDAIKRCTDSMTRMLRDLMDFVESRTTGLRVETAAVRVSELLNGALDLNAAIAGERRLRVDLDEAAQQLAVICDRERVLQIFSNLIGNAIKFTPAAGSITLRAERAGNEVRFAVADTGCGMNEQELRSIFQKYWQKRRNKGAGIGLGLYIVQTLVEAHGGKVWVQSAPQAGSTFFFTLRLAEGADASVRSSVLIVDDDTAVRRELREVLEAAGHDVYEAASGRQALLCLERRVKPGLILLDLMMPNMDGWEMLATVRAKPEFAKIPIVVMSCLDKSQVGLALQGTAGYLRKPPQLELLLDTVNRHCAAPHAATH